MKTIIAGLGLSLLAGVALAQTTAPSDPQPPPGATMPPPDAPQARRPQPGGPDGPAGNPEDYEGMIVQTPHGAYMVTEPDEGSDDRSGAPDRRGPMPPDAMRAMGPEGQPRPMSGMGGMPPMGPMGFRHPPGPPPSKAARFRIKSGDLELGVTCAADDSTKACVDAIAALIDKVGAAQHH